MGGKDRLLACAVDGGAAFKASLLENDMTASAGAIAGAWSEDARKELSRIQKLVQVIDLPTHPSFSDAYMDGMVFE